VPVPGRYPHLVEWIVVGVLAALFLGTSLLCLMVLIARNRVHRRHRVDPAVPTEAPLTWLVDPRAPARMHRRLARVGTTTTTVVDDNLPVGRRSRRRRVEPPPLASTAQELRAQAVALDQQLARLAMLGSAARRGPLVELGRAIADVEAAGARLVALNTQVRAPRGLDTDDTTLSDITRRIDRLAQAHHELLDVDAENHLLERPLPAPPLTASHPTPPRPTLRRQVTAARTVPRPAPTRSTTATRSAPAADRSAIAPPVSQPPTQARPQTWPPTPPSPR